MERQLAGRWLGSGVENVDDPSVAAATGWARGTSLEFAGGEVTVTIPAEEPRSGRYRLEAADDREVKLAVQRSDGGTDQLAMRFDSPDRIRWMVGGGRAVILDRER